MNQQQSSPANVFLSGNEAAGEAAIRAGCRLYAGYPITPQNELTAYMADQLPLRGGCFVQAESEIAAISMLHGASVAGARCMTSSSSPGISLKQEGISYLAASELPAVIINVMRSGPGLGDIRPSQADYFQATRGGGHGDYRCIVLAPSTVQEMADLTYVAFDLADRYRNPAVLLGDAMVGQMMAAITLDHLGEPRLPDKPWALTGAAGRPRNVIKSLYLVKGALEEHNLALQRKYRQIESGETRFERLGCEDAEFLIVAYGTCARLAKQVVARPLGKLPGKVGLLRPITLWPFPYAALTALASQVRGVLTVEMSGGQLVEDVRLAVGERCQVELLARMGGGVPTASEIAEKLICVFA